MSLVVKVMSGENIPDDDSRKEHRIYADVERASFVRKVDGNSSVFLYMKSGEDLEVILDGNCYVMNENGRTVSSFCPTKYTKTETNSPQK